MNTKTVIKSQYHAALAMLEQTIERCPNELWRETAVAGPFWRIAYHVLFYTHLYLQPEEDDFAPWEGQRGQAQYLGALPWAPQESPQVAEPYSKAEALAYLDFCRREMERQVAQLDPAVPSGFYWLPFNKLELQFYNIRHLQQHAGELSGRLGRQGIEIDWVGMWHD